MSPAEVILWQILRGAQLDGLRVRRQHPIGPYILDFYCPKARLAVEVDGRGHDVEERFRHDQRRAAWLKELGIGTLRIPARDVLDPDRRRYVTSAILAAVGGG